MPVSLLLRDASQRLACVEMAGRERLGEASAFDVVVVSEQSVSTKGLVGTPCAIVMDTAPLGDRVIRGVVWSVTTTMASSVETKRKYRFEIRSALALVELRRRTHVFQDMTVPEIIQKVLVAAGYHADDVALHLGTTHPKRHYVTQYDETDAAFVRRMCEEEGLYFVPVAGAEREGIALYDTSPSASDELGATLLIEDRSGALIARYLRAFDVRDVRHRRPGKVTVRAYDPLNPSADLRGAAAVGAALEKKVEIYQGAAPFLTPEEGATRAKARLEAERATARTLTFETNATSLHPGSKCALAPASGYGGAARPTGEFFVVALHHAWKTGDDSHALRVETIPLHVPFRLPMTTPRPRALGVHSAIVTGPPGQEIHTDAHGRVFLHFLWDREGPTDEKSSLPVRVMQPSMPGSMTIPRIGWEVWVMFEDGNPDRPYVLGRTYNATYPPPVSLPANKTMTAIQTASSPGGHAHNAITYDDAAGRQHMTMIAAKNQTTTVAHDAHVHTLKVDNRTVVGDLSRSVGAAESVTVKQAYLTQVASQTASVGANQSIFVKGRFMTGVASETVTIGAALLEQVGNPVTGVTNLASAAALHGVSAIPGVGPYLSAAGGVGMAAYQGYKAGGLRGVGMAGLGMVAGMVPGGDALLGSVQDAARPAPWTDTPAAAGAQQAGGGAGGDTKDHAAAKGPGPGHRNQVVKGAMTEAVGGAYGIVTPGSVAWKTTGMSTFVVGGSHMTKSGNYAENVKGLSTETLGALHIKSDANIQRAVKGTMTTTIAGALKSESGGPHHVKVKDKLTLTVGGSLDMKGSIVVFRVGSSVVAASPGGVLIESSEITITGDSKQSSKTTHQ